jgi:hypothetical protein
LKPTSRSWRIDETYIYVKGRRVYLYRAIDSQGSTIDFVLSKDAAKSLLSRALAQVNHPRPRVINTDKYIGHPAAIYKSKEKNVLRWRCKHRPVQYLNNILEQDHRAIKKRVDAKPRFVDSARRGGQSRDTNRCIWSGKAGRDGWRTAIFRRSWNRSTRYLDWRPKRPNRQSIACGIRKAKSLQHYRSDTSTARSVLVAISRVAGAARTNEDRYDPTWTHLENDA